MDMTALLADLLYHTLEKNNSAGANSSLMFVSRLLFAASYAPARAAPQTFQDAVLKRLTTPWLS